MRVAKATNGAVTLVLETQAEIDGLWAMAGHIGGQDTSLRNLFSSPSQDRSLFSMLHPFVSQMPPRLPGETHVNPPHIIQEVLHHHYQQTLKGALYFHPTTQSQQHDGTSQ